MKNKSNYNYWDWYDYWYEYYNCYKDRYSTAEIRALAEYKAKESFCNNFKTIK